MLGFSVQTRGRKCGHIHVGFSVNLSACTATAEVSSPLSAQMHALLQLSRPTSTTLQHRQIQQQYDQHTPAAAVATAGSAVPTGDAMLRQILGQIPGQILGQIQQHIQRQDQDGQQRGPSLSQQIQQIQQMQQGPHSNRGSSTHSNNRHCREEARRRVLQLWCRGQRRLWDCPHFPMGPCPGLNFPWSVPPVGEGEEFPRSCLS